MSAISDNLIHFLARAEKDSPNKQFEIFKLIFENGLRTGNNFLKFPDGSTIFGHIICFTDIPLNECNQHTAVYGKFGIGFKKSFVKNTGGNPAKYLINYMPGITERDGVSESRGNLYRHTSMFTTTLIKLSNRIKQDPDFSIYDQKGALFLSNEEIRDYIKLQVYMLSFEKETGDLGPARDDTEEIDLFYKEREWRIVHSKLDEDTGRGKLINGFGYYRFKRKDVNMIVVPNEEMRTCVLDYFLSLKQSTDVDLQEFGKNPLPIINYDDLQKW